MKTQKLISAKPSNRKSKHIANLSIIKDGNSYTSFATSHNGYLIPLIRGELTRVINETEHCAAYFSLPVLHELTPKMVVIIQTYQRVGLRWVWIRRDIEDYEDSNRAYFTLRVLGGEVNGLELTFEDANLRRVYTCSNACEGAWKTVIHRLLHKGSLPIGSEALIGQCPCCFSKFVKLMEEGQQELCLNCGHEQTRT